MRQIINNKKKLKINDKNIIFVNKIYNFSLRYLIFLFKKIREKHNKKAQKTEYIT